MSNKTAVVTGANSGLGFQTALKLARAAVRVVMACRSVEKARKAQKALLEELPAADTIVLPLDVSEPASIRAFGERVADRVGPLDLLINNAGVVAMPLSRNSAGHEQQLATNYLGAFALTGMLLPLFRGDAPARIVNVGSLAHRFGKLELDDLNWERAPYDEWKAYARSKLALLSFTMELNRRLRARGSNVIALGAHPGFAATEIAKNSPSLAPSNAVSKWFQVRAERWIPKAADAAMPILHAACAEDVAGGDYCGPCGFLEIVGRPGKARLNPLVKDVDLGRRLWALSESMTGVRFLPEHAREAQCEP